MSSITSIEGIQVGHASDFKNLTGCTVILCQEGAVGSVDVRGGASGSRELDPLYPSHLVGKVHAILLTGGSAFGLDAAGGVMKWLKEKKVGFNVGVAKIPIVPTAVIFDLWIGSADAHPDAPMGYAACENASSQPVEEGSVGAGTGATVGKILGVNHAMKGGIGSFATTLPHDVQVGALSVVNAWGDILDPQTQQILAGTRKAPLSRELADSTQLLLEGKVRKRYVSPNTTLAVVATNAILGKEEALRVAIMAQDGFARTIAPVHTQFDGDMVFVLSTGKVHADINAVGSAAASVVAESITRGIKTAKSLGGIPCSGDTSVGKRSWGHILNKRKSYDKS